MRRSRSDRRRIAAEMLAEIKCGHLARRYPATLSGGEKQRVALARALLPAPGMLLLDEPLAAMDAAARRGLRGYLARHLTQRRRPAIVVTHDARDVYALGSPGVYALEAGKVVQRGSPEFLAAEPATDFIAEFFAGRRAPLAKDEPRKRNPLWGHQQEGLAKRSQSNEKATHTGSGDSGTDHRQSVGCRIRPGVEPAAARTRHVRILLGGRQDDALLRSRLLPIHSVLR